MSARFHMDDIYRIVDDLENQVNNLPLEAIGTLLQNAIDDLIESEGHGKWPKLAPSTLKRRPRRKGGRLLQDRGFLNKIQVETGRNWVSAGTPVTYGIYHVTGTRNMPQRDFLDIDMDQFVEDAGNLIAADILG